MGNCSLRRISDQPAKGFDFIRVVTLSGDVLKLESPKLVGEILIAFPGHKIFGQDHVSSPLFNHEYLVSGKSYYLLPSETCNNRCMEDLKLTTQDDQIPHTSANPEVDSAPNENYYHRCREDTKPIKEDEQILHESLNSEVHSAPNKMFHNRCMEDFKPAKQDDQSIHKSANPPKDSAPNEKCYNRCVEGLKSIEVDIEPHNLSNPKADSAAIGKEPVRMSSAGMEIVTSLARGSGLQVLGPKQKGVWRVKLAISPRQLEEILAEEVNTEALIEQMRMAAATSVCFTPKGSKRSGGLICKPVFANARRFSTQSATEFH